MFNDDDDPDGTMKKVTKEEFYNIIEPIEVALFVVGELGKSYKILYKTRGGELVGVIQEYFNNRPCEYFLNRGGNPK